MTRRTLLIAWILALATHAAAIAQSATSPAGHWEGAIDVPGQALAIEVDLASKDGAWIGTITIPAQNLKGFPLSDITVAGTAVGFAMKGVAGGPRFAGTLSSDGKAITGDFTQGGGTIGFNLAWKGDPKFEEPTKSTEITKDLEGSWEGALDVQGTVLRLVLKLANHPGGATGVLVSVDQGGAEIPITSITQTLSHLAFAITLINASYTGDLKDGQIAGTWTQGPGSWPLMFKRPAK
ncbi:MAG: hypothetical protein JJE40_13500 [Vicinamibacteria bacterium]|nr:hypothetical protein [Vicinamibacteria bacterium]